MVNNLRERKKLMVEGGRWTVVRCCVCVLHGRMMLS